MPGTLAGMAFYSGPLGWAKRVVREPLTELTRTQLSLRYGVDLFRHCGRQLLEDRAEEMAAALTFRTVFSLVPLFVLGLIIFRVFGGFDNVSNNLQEQLYRMFVYFDVPEQYEQAGPGPGQGQGGEPAVQEPLHEGPDIGMIEVGTVQEAADQKEAAAAAARGEGPVEAIEKERQNREEVRLSFRKVLNNAMASFASLDFSKVGIGGLAVFLYAAIALAFSVEYDFNIIFKAPTGRPWHLRLPIYWSMITLGIAMLALTFWLTGEIQDRVTAYIGPVWGALNFAFAFLTSWMLLFLLYWLMPNAAVRLKPAAIGSGVAAVLWEASKVGFQSYVNHALPYAAFYGTVGLIPLFLFWVYLSWLIVLFGLELTYALQMMRGRRRLMRLQANFDEYHPVIDPQWTLPVIATVGEGFEKGNAVTVEDISARLTMPLAAARKLCEHLQSRGLLHRLVCDDEEDPGYVLAMPPDRLDVSRVLKAGEELTGLHNPRRDAPGVAALRRLRAAEHEAAGGQTLADVLRTPEATGEPAADKAGREVVSTAVKTGNGRG